VYLEAKSCIQTLASQSA